MKYFVESLPRSCFYCDCCHEKEYDCRYKIEGDKFCAIENLEVNYYYDHNLQENVGRPNWCPLKELPERKEGFGTDGLYLKGKIDGWNYCLAEILGE